MSTEKPSGNESIDTDEMTNTSHDLGGISVDGAAMQVQNVEDGARVVVDLIEPVDASEVVSVAIRSDTISGRAYLDAEAAAAVADRLATVAQAADTDK